MEMRFSIGRIIIKVLCIYNRFDSIFRIPLIEGYMGINDFNIPISVMMV